MIGLSKVQKKWRW